VFLGAAVAALPMDLLENGAAERRVDRIESDAWTSW
jgi:hypothetical protein